MAQIFDRSSNALARASLVLTGLIVIALGVTLDQLQRSPWVTRQGQRPEQPVPFSHKHHVQGLGLQCQYCHTSVEKSSYAGIPPTKTCINCHAQIWTNAQLLEPVRESWATGQSIPWIKVHDLPDYVYFSHEIHVNKGLGCASCHGRVDQMPLMYAAEYPADGVVPRLPSQSRQRTCGPPARFTTWRGKRRRKIVRCGAAVGNDKGSVPTAQSVNCVTKDPSGTRVRRSASLHIRRTRSGMARLRRLLEPRCRPHCTTKSSPARIKLGHFLLQQYNIRTPHELTSCEVCHR